MTAIGYLEPETTEPRRNVQVAAMTGQVPTISYFAAYSSNQTAYFNPACCA